MFLKGTALAIIAYKKEEKKKTRADSYLRSASLAYMVHKGQTFEVLFKTNPMTYCPKI